MCDIFCLIARLLTHLVAPKRYQHPVDIFFVNDAFVSLLRSVRRPECRNIVYKIFVWTKNVFNLYVLNVFQCIKNIIMKKNKKQNFNFYKML